MFLRLQDINHSFSRTKKVLDNVSFDLRKSKIYALMGVNGSGKTTLFNIITGYLRPQSGQMFYGEENVHIPFGNGLGVGLVARTFQDLRLVTKLSVKENIILAIRNNPTQLWYKALLPSSAYRKPLRALEEQAEQIITTCLLDKVKDRLGGEISYGEQKLVNLACCIANDASLMLLDEPVAGINPEHIKKTVELLKTLRTEGKTILLIEHNTDFSQQVADHFLFLNNGKLRSYETFTQLISDNEVLQAYI